MGVTLADGAPFVLSSNSNPDLRRTETIVESPLQRTSSGSSSSSSTPSSQPSSQGGSQPGSQAGSSERNRVRGELGNIPQHRARFARLPGKQEGQEVCDLMLVFKNNLKNQRIHHF